MLEFLPFWSPFFHFPNPSVYFPLYKLTEAQQSYTITTNTITPTMIIPTIIIPTIIIPTTIIPTIITTNTTTDNATADAVAKFKF